MDSFVENKWHYYSDGRCQVPIIENEKDGVYAMNLYGIMAHNHGVKVLNVVWMMNHSHGILDCTQSQGMSFDMEYRRALTKHLRAEGKEVNDLITSLDPIQERNELLQKWMYVYKNPSNGGYMYLPHNYLWGPGDIFFTPRPRRVGKRVGDLSAYGKYRLFGTKMPIPDEWMYDERGMIFPECYIDVRQVESLFVSPLCFTAFLAMRKKDMETIRMQCSNRTLAKLTEKELRTKVAEQSQLLFNKRLTELIPSERIAIARHFWVSGSGYSVKQLARATHTNPEYLAEILQ